MNKDTLKAIFKDVGSLSDKDIDLLEYWEITGRSEYLKTLPSPNSEPQRWRLPDERSSLTHRFKIHCEPENVVGYMTSGFYKDGKLGEVFLNISKIGTLVSGLTDALMFCISVSLQHGIPLETFTRRFKHTRFEPSGYAESLDGKRRYAKSILDYIAWYLEERFVETDSKANSKNRL